MGRDSHSQYHKLLSHLVLKYLGKLLAHKEFWPASSSDKMSVRYRPVL